MSGENYAEEAASTPPEPAQPGIVNKRWVRAALAKAAGKKVEIVPIQLKPNPHLQEMLDRQGLTLEPDAPHEPRQDIYEYDLHPERDDS